MSEITSRPGGERPRIFITNDDGIDAPGIHWLARAAAEEDVDVVVAAPLNDASGSSAAMTGVQRDGRIVVERRTLPGLPDVPAYGVAASPAFIVVLALREAFGPAPDLVLSGINRGANAGQAVLHSGTVGAALTAAGEGLRGLAVSLDVFSPTADSAAEGVDAVAAVAAAEEVDDDARHWRDAARLAVGLLPALTAAPAGTVLNLNVPDVPAERLRGLRRAALARFGQVQMKIAEAGEGFVRTAVEESGEPLEPDSDLAWLAEGYAAVTPIRAVGEAADVPLDLDGAARPRR
jgi:5'-nucleotidase